MFGEYGVRFHFGDSCQLGHESPRLTLVTHACHILVSKTER
jgi:hypothetical protein